MYLYLLNNKKPVNIHGLYVIYIELFFLGQIFHCISILLNKTSILLVSIPCGFSWYLPLTNIAGTPRNCTSAAAFSLLSDQRFHHEAVSRRVVLFTFNTCVDKYIADIRCWTNGLGFLYAFRTAEQSLCLPRPAPSSPQPIPGVDLCQVPPVKLTWYLSHRLRLPAVFLHIIRNMQNFFKLIAVRAERENSSTCGAPATGFSGVVYCLPSSYCAADALNAKTKPASASQIFSWSTLSD